MQMSVIRLGEHATTSSISIAFKSGPRIIVHVHCALENGNSLNMVTENISAPTYIKCFIITSSIIVLDRTTSHFLIAEMYN